MDKGRVYNKNTDKRQSIFSLVIIPRVIKGIAILIVILYILSIVSFIGGLFIACYFLFHCVSDSTDAVIFSACTSAILTFFISFLEFKYDSTSKLYSILILKYAQQKLKKTSLMLSDKTFCELNQIVNEVNQNKIFKYRINTDSCVLESIAILHELFINTGNNKKIFVRQNEITEIGLDTTNLAISSFMDNYKRCRYLTNLIVLYNVENMDKSARSKIYKLIFDNSNIPLAKGFISFDNTGYSNFIKESFDMFTSNKGVSNILILVAALHQSTKGFFSRIDVLNSIKELNVISKFNAFRLFFSLTKTEQFSKMPYKILGHATFVLRRLNDEKIVQTDIKTVRCPKKVISALQKLDFNNAITNFEIKFLCAETYDKLMHESFIFAMNTCNYAEIERIFNCNSNNKPKSKEMEQDYIILEEKLGNRKICDELLEKYTIKDFTKFSLSNDSDSLWGLLLTYIENKHVTENGRSNFNEIHTALLKRAKNEFFDTEKSVWFIILRYWQYHIAHEKAEFKIGQSKMDDLFDKLLQLLTLVDCNSNEEEYYKNYYIRRLCSDYARTLFITVDIMEKESAVNLMTRLQKIKKATANLPEAYIYSLRYEFGDSISFVLLYSKGILHSSIWDDFATKFLCLTNTDILTLSNACLDCYKRCKEMFLWENNKGLKTTEPRICDVEMTFDNFDYIDIQGRINDFILTTDGEVFESYGKCLLAKLNILQAINLHIENINSRVDNIGLSLPYDTVRKHLENAKEILRSIKNPSNYTISRQTVFNLAICKVNEYIGATNDSLENTELQNDSFQYRERIALKKLEQAISLDEIRNVVRYYNIILL